MRRGYLTGAIRAPFERASPRILWHRFRAACAFFRRREAARARSPAVVGDTVRARSSWGRRIRAAFLAGVARAHRAGAVVAQPDRPAGRGHKTVAPPVAPGPVRRGEVAPAARAAGAGVLDALGAPPGHHRRGGLREDPAPRLAHAAPRGCVNVHASLLPATGARRPSSGPSPRTSVRQASR